MFSLNPNIQEPSCFLKLLPSTLSTMAKLAIRCQENQCLVSASIPPELKTLLMMNACRYISTFSWKIETVSLSMHNKLCALQTHQQMAKKMLCLSHLDSLLNHAKINWSMKKLMLSKPMDNHNYLTEPWTLKQWKMLSIAIVHLGQEGDWSIPRFVWHGSRGDSLVASSPNEKLHLL